VEQLIWLGIRFVVFGVALTFAMKKVKDVKVTPPHALPLVALVFALLNTLLYWLLAPVLNLVTLWTLWFLVPFLANGVFLYVTDRILKPLKIEGMVAFLKTAGIVTVAHLVLRVAEKVVAAVR
jgi:uncharacterized membrane protein YvlD (DUF360 family)